MLARMRGVRAGRHLQVKGRPLVEIMAGAELSLGENVTLNSRNSGYHVNMHSPVKLLLDGEGARISIGDDTRVHGACLHAQSSIRVGKRCLIAANCQIMDSNGHDVCFEDVRKRISSKGAPRPVVIEDDVWLGAGATVLPGVRIGRGAVVGAGSVVASDVPEMVVVAGNPARITARPKTREE